ncbi:MAG: hypothetical protein OXG80_02615 [Chloroflexi bacterium]|nr:hypothetical protein [Chloroflexota bacterium]
MGWNWRRKKLEVMQDADRLHSSRDATDRIQGAGRRYLHTYWGEIPPHRGVWANADSLKKCEKELESVLEDWILISLNFGDAIPEIDGVRVCAKAKGLV